MFGSRWLLVAFAVIAMVIATPASPVLSQSQIPHTSILLISWDGVERSHLISLLSQGRMPNAARLIGEGGLVNMTVEGHATETIPGHVEMLTGYPPNLTGAYTNLDYSVVPANLTLFERLKAFFGGGIVTVICTGKPLAIDYATDPSQYEVINWTMSASHPLYNARSSVDFLDLNRANASVVGAKALGYLETCKGERSFMFIHFREPDYAGHKFGEGSAEYDEAIVECDRWLGSITAALDSLGIYNSTTIYVTTDHGFDEGGYGHSYAPEIWLFTNDAGIDTSMAARQGDLVPTILAKFGIDPASLSPPLPGKPLTPITRTSQSLQAGGLTPQLMAVIALAIALGVALTMVSRRKSANRGV